MDDSKTVWEEEEVSGGQDHIMRIGSFWKSQVSAYVGR